MWVPETALECWKEKIELENTSQHKHTDKIHTETAGGNQTVRDWESEITGTTWPRLSPKSSRKTWREMY